MLSSVIRIHRHLKQPRVSSAAFGTSISVVSWSGGQPTVIPATPERTVLDLARSVGVQLEGACEGSLSCSTCHVILDDPVVYAALPPPCEDELDMLDVAFNLTPTSRLGCCLDGYQAAALSPGSVLRVRLPPVPHEESLERSRAIIASDSPAEEPSLVAQKASPALFEPSHQQRRKELPPLLPRPPQPTTSGQSVRRVEVVVEHADDPGISDVGAHFPLLHAVANKLGLVAEMDNDDDDNDEDIVKGSNTQVKPLPHASNEGEGDGADDDFDFSLDQSSQGAARVKRLHRNLQEPTTRVTATAAAVVRLADLRVVRKSLDARRSKRGGGSGSGGPRFNYVVDVLVSTGQRPPQGERFEPKKKTMMMKKKKEGHGRQETPLVKEKGSGKQQRQQQPHKQEEQQRRATANVVVVGAGPAGLFAALRLGQAFARERARRLRGPSSSSGGSGGSGGSDDGDQASSALPHLRVTLLERGQAVDRRGADIGAMYVQKQLDPESNMLFGMGGAGTWSDGKLTTRIGHNSDDVRSVLEDLVELGAPPAILAQGKPHLGTDRMVHVLRALQKALASLGCVEVRFGQRVKSVQVESGRVTGVVVASGSGSGRGQGESVLPAEAVLLAPGHSSRDLYERLHCEGKVQLAFQPFSVGLRAEHPQSWLNAAQYGESLAGLASHKGKLPVADYSLVAKASKINEEGPSSESLVQQKRRAVVAQRRNNRSGAGAAAGNKRNMGGGGGSGEEWTTRDNGKRSDGNRTVYSFCMCPGGQVVPTALTPDELCVNGMSFSKRASPFANSGVVAPVTLADCAPFVDQTPLLFRPSSRVGSISSSSSSSSSGGGGGGEECRLEELMLEAEEEAEEEAARSDPMVLAGLAFQRSMERDAALRGGGRRDLTAPAQTIDDFLHSRAPAHGGPGNTTALGQPLPASSYRPGVRSSSLHDLYPAAISAALARGLEAFGDPARGGLEGYAGAQGLLHGVETRTSAPVRIVRDKATMQSPSAKGLFPLGEGAGYAGGIMSAAVDGSKAARVLLQELGIGDTADIFMG